jgi:hypothetical protein
MAARVGAPWRAARAYYSEYGGHHLEFVMPRLD